MNLRVVNVRSPQQGSQAIPKHASRQRCVEVSFTTLKNTAGGPPQALTRYLEGGKKEICLLETLAEVQCDLGCVESFHEQGQTPMAQHK